MLLSSFTGPSVVSATVCIYLLIEDAWYEERLSLCITGVCLLLIKKILERCQVRCRDMNRPPFFRAPLDLIFSLILIFYKLNYFTSVDI